MAHVVSRRQPRDVIEILNGIPGAWDRIALGLEQAQIGQTIDLDRLVAPPIANARSSNTSSGGRQGS